MPNSTVSIIMYKTILKNSCVFFIAFLISLSFFGCKKEAPSVLDTIKERGVMKVGLGIFVPWAMKDKQGELVGFEIDVAKSIAEELGVEIEFIPTAWDGIILHLPNLKLQTSSCVVFLTSHFLCFEQSNRLKIPELFHRLFLLLNLQTILVTLH